MSLSNLKQKFGRKHSSKPSAVFYTNHGSNGDLPGKPDDVKSLGGLSNLSLDDDRVSRASTAMVLGEGLLMPDEMYLRLEPSYLPGEVMISRAERVMRYIPYSDCRQGVLGAMVVTNFRVVFLPVKQRNSGLAMQNMVWRNKLYNEDDILLNNIEAAYQVSKSRKRKMVAGKHGDIVKKIEIHCKDFRIHQFNFESAKQDHAHGITNAIAHFSFPDKLDRQFAFSYQSSTQPNEPPIPVPDFSSRQGWENELKRLRTKSFRVADCNMQFIDSQFMPMFFVVPSIVTNENLKNDMKTYEDYRVPVWSYTHSNGSSLVRSTFPIANCPDPEYLEKGLVEMLRQNHPEKKKPLMFDVHEAFPSLSGLENEERLKLPSLRDIKHSHDKLKEICMPVTVKELESSDGSWYSSLESTKWLTYVAMCLKVSTRIAQIITGDDALSLNKKFRRISVIVKEHDGARDLTPLITSLVQLILDPYCHTLVGLQTVIEKEWVALGHKFTDRYSLVTSPDGEDRQCPVFLLFLDCVHQLLKQLPKTFEFSEYYLTILWDSVCSGLFSNFIFNCQHEMINEVRRGDRFSKLGVDKKLSSSLLNVWNLPKQYSESDLSLFKNPAYQSFVEESEAVMPPQRTIKVLAKYYKEKPSDSFINLDLDEELRTGSQRLIPDINWCEMSFWAGCFLRWLTPIQVMGGGLCMEYILESLIQEEILMIQNNIKEVEQAKAISNTPVKSQMEFTPFWTTKRHLLDNLSSSFPYTPSRPTTQVSFFGTPIKMCVEEFTSSSELEASLSSVGDMCES